MVAVSFRGSSSRLSGNRCSVRYVLTIIAVALVAVMSAALVTPLLVDWSAHRAEIQAQLRSITGANVSLTGPIEVRLLPTPYLALGEGALSAPGANGPKLSFASARLELALVKLASGQIRFSDIRLEKPVLTIARGVDGALLNGRFLLENAQGGELVLDIFEGGEDGIAVAIGLRLVAVARRVGERVALAGVEEQFGCLAA